MEHFFKVSDLMFEKMDERISNFIDFYKKTAGHLVPVPHNDSESVKSEKLNNKNFLKHRFKNNRNLVNGHYFENFEFFNLLFFILKKNFMLIEFHKLEKEKEKQSLQKLKTSSVESKDLKNKRESMAEIFSSYAFTALIDDAFFEFNMSIFSEWDLRLFSVCEVFKRLYYLNILRYYLFVCFNMIENE